MRRRSSGRSPLAHGATTHITIYGRNASEATALYYVNKYEVQNDRPMIGALVVRASDGLPGDGLYDCAHHPERLASSDPEVERTFPDEELARVIEYWSAPERQESQLDRIVSSTRSSRSWPHRKHDPTERAAMPSHRGRRPLSFLPGGKFAAGWPGGHRPDGLIQVAGRRADPGGSALNGRCLASDRHPDAVRCQLLLQKSRPEMPGLFDARR